MTEGDLIQRYGMLLDAGTPDGVAEALLQAQDQPWRIRIVHGDPETGRGADFGVAQVGYLVDGLGRLHRPCLSRHYCPKDLVPIRDTHHIVRIERTDRPKRGVLWEHPTFHTQTQQEVTE